jgi:hypothetical protein
LKPLTPVGSFFGGNGFVADRPGVLHTHTTSDGAGSYRLAINPFAGTGWYIEVDALKLFLDGRRRPTAA